MAGNRKDGTKPTKFTKFQLFYKDFMEPYGGATTHFNSDIFEKRLKWFTCPIISKPAVGISEMAETLNTNTERLRKYLPTLNKNWAAIDGMLGKVTEFTQHLDMHATPHSTRKNLVGLHDLLMGEEMLEKDLKLMAHVGASLYLSSLYMLTMRFLFRHPDFVKEESAKCSYLPKTMKGFNTTDADMRDWCKRVGEEMSGNIKRKTRSTIDLESPDEAEIEEDEVNVQNHAPALAEMQQLWTRITQLQQEGVNLLASPPLPDLNSQKGTLSMSLHLYMLVAC